MEDYTGKYVKRFESGNKGSLAFSNCGCDWGLSCGSYQLTLRWGNCINFLKKYFPNESKGLYFSNLKDIATKNYPGSAYCSSPEAVISVWQLCYNKVGADTFGEYEIDHMKTTYYDKVLSKVKATLDVEKLNDRAFKECFWSWGIHKGVTGSVNQFNEVIKEHNWQDLTFVDKEVLFDAIYDKRYQVNPVNRYKKGLTNGSSEREVLRPLLTHGTVSGLVYEVVMKKEEEEFLKQMKEVLANVVTVNGTLKVIYKGDDGLNVREYPSTKSKVLNVFQYGKEATVVAVTKDNTFYKMNDGTWISANEKYVRFAKINPDDLQDLYLVRIQNATVPIYKEANVNSTIVGYVKKNQAFTIVKESNGFGKLKSGSGWLKLDSSIKKL